MLELRYNKSTKKVTAWCGNKKQFGNLDRQRAEEAVIVFDVHIPDKPLGAWLFDNGKLISNPSYVDPKPVRDLAAEIDELKAWRAQLEK